MKNVIQTIEELGSLTRTIAQLLEPPFAADRCTGALKILAAVRSFLRPEVTPKSFERLERRLETLFRGLARLLLQRAVHLAESSQRPNPVTR